MRIRNNRTLLATTLASLLTDISSDMITFLLPIVLTATLHTPVALVGLIEGMAETTSSLTKVVSGALADRLRRRKWLVVAGYALSSGAKALLLLAQAWPLVAVSRFADRLGKGVRTPPRDALLAASVSAEQRGAAFGLHRAGDTLGSLLGIGAALSFIVLTNNGSFLPTSAFRWVVLLSLLPALLGVGVLAWGLPTLDLPATSTPTWFTWHGLPRTFRWFLLIVALFTLGNSADAFFVLLAQAQGASISVTLLMVLSFNVVYTLLAAPLGAWSDRVGRRRVLLWGWAIYVLVYVGLAGARQLWMVWLWWAVYGVYYALTEGVAKALVADLVPSTMRGRAYGVYSATTGLLALPASLLAGLLWQRFSPAAAFGFGAVCALLAWVLLAAGVGGRQAQA